MAFSVLRPDGSPVGCVRVERAAAAEGVHVRAGCCCNPGACERAVRAPPGRPRRARAAGKICGDDVDVDDAGVAMGVVRASFGASSAPEDADRLADVVARHFEERDTCFETETSRGGETSLEGFREVTRVTRVTRVATFPIKGAAAYEPPGGAWPVGPCGLLYDREWALASPSGEILCPRRVPDIARLRPEIDLVRETLRVRVDGSPGTGTGRGRDATGTNPRRRSSRRFANSTRVTKSRRFVFAGRRRRFVSRGRHARRWTRGSPPRSARRARWFVANRGNGRRAGRRRGRGRGRGRAPPSASPTPPRFCW